MNDNTALPHGTPVAVAASVTGSGVASYFNYLSDIHELAVMITVIAGSLSIVISLVTLAALLKHLVNKK